MKSVSLSNNEGIKHIFTGEPYRKVPVFSNELVVASLRFLYKVALVFRNWHHLFTGTWQLGTCRLL